MTHNSAPIESGTKTMTYERPPWTDYFDEPSIEQLRDTFPEEVRPLFDKVQKTLGKVNGTTQKLKWFGDGWHWTIGYFTRHCEEPLAILIPNPTDLQLAMPLNGDFMDSLKSDQIKKSLRDGLELALKPFDTHWAVWSLENETILADLMDFVELKRKHLSKIAG